MTTELLEPQTESLPFADPPKLYVIRLSHEDCESDAVYFYDANHFNMCASTTKHYWLEFLYWLPPEGMDYDHPDVDQYLDADNDDHYQCCWTIDAIEESPEQKILVHEATPDWYTFESDDDQNTEKVYNKYMDDWREKLLCNHYI